MSTASDKRAMVLQNQGLVRSIAATVFTTIGQKVELDDLIAYGQIGLAEAVEDFDPDRGFQFSTYAYYRIRGSILDGAYQMSWYNRAQIRRMKFESLAHEALQQNEHVDSLAATSSSVSNLVVIGLTLDAAALEQNRLSEDQKTDSPEATVLHDEACEKLFEAIAALPGDEHDLIRAVYFDGESLADYSRKNGKQRYWGTRVHHRAIERLGESLRCIGAPQRA